MISVHLLLAAVLFSAAPQGTAADTVLRTLEGKVAAVGETAGEGDLPVVTLEMQTRDGDFKVLVAPAEVLADIGFSVAVGDRVRVRVFLEPVSRLAYAQKLLNQSRDLMIRLRTLRHEPLWDAAGKWQGSSAELPSRRAAETAGRGDRGRGKPERNPSPPPPPPQQ